MKKKERFVSIKTKIMISTIIPVILSFSLICFITFTSLFNSLHETAKAELSQISQKYAVGFESKINSAMDYLSIIASMLELRIQTGTADREFLQKSVFDIFENYGFIDGSSIYFESDMYDGRDSEYVGSHYGTERSGRICYYFYKDEGKTAYLPEALEDDIEFSLPHYTEAKKANKAIYTEPTVYEVDGRSIPMFTITYPVRDQNDAFIGAVTVDLFLKDIYEQVQSEEIYKSGYVLIANDKNQLIYSPRFEDIGKTRSEAGLNYDLLAADETSASFYNNSIINGRDALISLKSIYIPQLDSHFYVSVTASTNEINERGFHLLSALITFSAVVVVVIALLLYYLIGRISAPIKEITESANEIAKGEYSARIKGDYKNEFAIVKDSINAMADSIETYVNESKSSVDILKNILNGLDAYVYVTIPETGEILFINEAMKQLFNIEGDGIGQLCYKTFQKGKDSECEFCPLKQLSKNPDEAVIWELVSPITHRVYQNTDCFIDWPGGVKAHLQHSIDITDIKQAMDDKLKAEREALEFKHEKEKAESAAQAKNDFLAKMSHEIRTPMNAVMGMTELILRKDLPQDVYENALMIKSSSANLLSIINDILDFSKIESGKLEIIETEYLLPSLINDVLSVIRIRLVDKPIQFVVNIDPTIPASLIGDEIRIRQVLINLLSNAVNYTDEGYISLEISGSVSGNETALTLAVSDSGIGIKEEDIGKLFGDFVQIDKVKNKGVVGTGLGLAITRNLCRLMGGDIKVSSEYGKGSVFAFDLTQKLTKYTPFASIDNPDSKSVLLYETRQFYRESIVKTFESLGVFYKNVENIPALFDDLENYDYVFVSSFAYGSIWPALSKLEKKPKLVLLADITETTAPKSARVLTLPAHALSIANILNDIDEIYGGMNMTGASFIAPDAKVLVVDDIMANLKVGEGLLLPYEMQVTLCSSGKEAIELAAKEHYDLIFMDHMMPEMDGLEATRHIRELEGEYFKTLPIIALTANAVSGVKEMFIQNGMNDFLAKPIETAKLDAVLGKWIPKDKRLSAKPKEQQAENNDFVETLQSVRELSVQKALSVVGGSADTYERIVRLSVHLLPENIARLNSLIDTDMPSYGIEVHGMKSVLNNIGAYELGQKALELEELSKDGNIEACKSLHPGFIEKLEEFLHLMNTVIVKTNVAGKTEGDISLLRETLHKLQDAIEFYDSALALEIISSIEDYTYGKDTDEMIIELLHAFERFDFDMAAEMLNKLSEATQ